MIPDLLIKLPLCRGIFVGGCVERGVGSSFRAVAHTHNLRSDPFFGWICFRKATKLMDYFKPEPSPMLWHEYAHLLAPDSGHGPAWKRACATLGRSLGVHVNLYYIGKRK